MILAARVNLKRQGSTFPGSLGIYSRKQVKKQFRVHFFIRSKCLAQTRTVLLHLFQASM